MIKIEKIFEVSSIDKTVSHSCDIPGQFTHFRNIEKSNKLPFINRLMVVLPLGATTAGKKFRMILEEYDEDLVVFES